MASKGKSSFTITDRVLRDAAVRRDLLSNKYSNGRLLIIGGSSSYYGAPVLAINAACQSLTALRVGAGYVKAFVPASILDASRTLSPNTVIQALGKDNIIFNDQIKAEIEKADAIVLGMGIAAGSAAAARKIVAYAAGKSKKVIVDADAIAALKGVKVAKPASVLATPHDGEFYKLTGVKLESNVSLDKRATEAAKAAGKQNLIIVLKGHHTLVTDGSKTGINKADTAVLATMGTGDVLSGIIGGYAATGNDLFKSALAGVYLHSKIGDELYKEMGNHVIATDLIRRIPQILKKYDKN